MIVANQEFAEKTLDNTGPQEVCKPKKHCTLESILSNIIYLISEQLLSFLSSLHLCNIL
jgi:hypothetical protein